MILELTEGLSAWTIFFDSVRAKVYQAAKQKLGMDWMESQGEGGGIRSQKKRSTNSLDGFGLSNISSQRRQDGKARESVPYVWSSRGTRGGVFDTIYLGKVPGTTRIVWILSEGWTRKIRCW